MFVVYMHHTDLELCEPLSELQDFSPTQDCNCVGFVNEAGEWIVGAGDTIGGALDDAGNAIGDGIGAIGDGLGDAGDAIGGGLGAIGGALGGLGRRRQQLGVDCCVDIPGLDDLLADIEGQIDSLIRLDEVSVTDFSLAGIMAEPATNPKLGVKLTLAGKQYEFSKEVDVRLSDVPFSEKILECCVAARVCSPCQHGCCRCIFSSLVQRHNCNALWTFSSLRSKHAWKSSPEWWVHGSATRSSKVRRQCPISGESEHPPCSSFVQTRALLSIEVVRRQVRQVTDPW